MLKVFGATIFLGAALLFVVQPMIARMVLPLLGGSPSVWNGCMLFFQGVLLAGYLYAHVVGSVQRTRLQLWLHAGLLLGSVVLLTQVPPGIARNSLPPSEGSPVPWMLAALAQGIGVPFLMLSTGSSLLQRFFSRTDHEAAADPYFLYSASNAGSMVGLLGYPLVIEPVFTLGQQRLLFAAGYLLWAILTVVCGVLAVRRPRAESAAARTKPDRLPAPITITSRLYWILLSFVPSSLLLSVTLFITTDVAAAPFLWVLPLALYLLTFIVAFSSRGSGAVRWAGWLLIPALAVLVGVVISGIRQPLVPIVAVHLAVLLFGGIACHGRLAGIRPSSAGLTEFYLWIAVGGVLGGLFNALAAPMLFDSVDEYGVAVALLCVVGIPDLPKMRPVLVSAVRIACAAVAGSVLVVSGRSSGLDQAEVVYRERTFFGVYRVVSLADGFARSLYHGTTMHGRQVFGDRDAKGERSSTDRFRPVTYYHPSGPIGEVFQWKSFESPPGFHEVGLVGLGIGTLAAYGKDKSQHFTYYEIDPAVVRIANDTRYFTYLADSDATVSTVVGDARLMLAREPDAKFDLLVLDAFSSDAIPVHLMTREAFELYLAKLKPDGLLAVHVTNRHLDLLPVVGNIARSLNVAAFGRRDLMLKRNAEEQQQIREGKAISIWVLVVRNARAIGTLSQTGLWIRYENRTTGRPWTDDYSNILGVLSGS